MFFVWMKGEVYFQGSVHEDATNFALHLYRKHPGELIQLYEGEKVIATWRNRQKAA